MKLPRMTASQSLGRAGRSGAPERFEIDGFRRSARIEPAVRVNTADHTDQEWLDETCLDARDVPHLDHVTLDATWHRDNRYNDYGEHLTYSLYDAEGHRLDTCHAYQELTADGCLVTFCQNDYGGHGVADGHGFYGYLADTHPG